MKILCISHGSTLNGAERSFVEMLEALSLFNHELYAIFPYEGPIIEKCKNFLIDYTIQRQLWWIDRGVTLSVNKKLRLLKGLIYDIKDTNSIIKKYDPDIVITNTSVIPCGALSSKLMSKPHIWYLRELGKDDLGFNFIYGKKLTIWLINKLSSKILCNSNFLKSYYLKYIRNKQKISTIYQAVKINDTINSSCNLSLTLILTGRFAEGKGQLEAVKAINILKQKEENVTLLLVGSGRDTYSIQVKEYIDTYNLSDNIKVIDFIENVSEFYKNADIALVCSRCEAFGRITIEAMKMGLPVIASNTGANPELVKNGFNGYIYKYGNPQDLADKILLMKDETLRIKMSQQAHHWAIEKFNINNFAEDLNKLIKEIKL